VAISGVTDSLDLSDLRIPFRGGRGAEHPMNDPGTQARGSFEVQARFKSLKTRNPGIPEGAPRMRRPDFDFNAQRPGC